MPHAFFGLQFLHLRDENTGLYKMDLVLRGLGLKEGRNVCMCVYVPLASERWDIGQHGRALGLQ